MSASSLNVDTQRRIADEIERRNIDENMVRAMEETPESFIQVAMLWINMKVNGHRVKGIHLLDLIFCKKTSIRYCG